MSWIVKAVSILDGEADLKCNFYWFESLLAGHLNKGGVY